MRTLSPIPKWVCIAAVVTVMALTSVLHFLNPKNFPVLASISAIVAFVAIAWPLIYLLRSVLNQYGGNEAQDGTIHTLFDEMAGGLGLILIGFLAGSVGGTVWWVAAGHEMTSFVSAMLSGGLLGALLFTFLVGGI